MYIIGIIRITWYVIIFADELAMIIFTYDIFKDAKMCVYLALENEQSVVK